MSRGDSGSLTLIGVGYSAAGHITPEALVSIESADTVFFLVDDPLAQRWLRSLRPDAVSLYRFAEKGKELSDCCSDMVRHVLGEALAGRRVAVAFDGHPGVGVFPSREMRRRASEEGLKFRMLPGISAADCLFADLGVDPRIGCQIFAANHLLERRFKLDRRSGLILFQLGAIGITRYRTDGRVSRTGLRQLVDFLGKFYRPEHEVVVYEAAMTPISGPRIAKLPLRRLSRAPVTPISTLYVPPVKR